MKRLFNFFKKQTDKNIDLNDSNYISNQESILSKLNNEKQKELLNNGFIKLKVLDTEKTNQLLNLYLSQPNARREDFGFHVSLDINQENIVNTIAQKISEIIQPNVDLFLNNYQFISPRFAVKEANQNSLVPPHQDWSFVDETEFQSYNLWIALSPSKLDNGTLGFLPKSHNK